jgi:Lrp/AsnC family transcriptional regulator, leucine-responsive regulatory protein
VTLLAIFCCNQYRRLTYFESSDISFLSKVVFSPKVLSLIDPIDLKILFILQNQGRSRLADIADEVELSAPAVMERVKKLEATGVIKGYQALLDAKKVGKDITAFIGVSIGNQRDIDKFATQMLRNPDVLECHHVTGDESFILKVKSADTTSLEKLLGEIRSVEGVTRTVTKVVLSTAKESQIFDLTPSLAQSSNSKRK